MAYDIAVLYPGIPITWNPSRFSFQFWKKIWPGGRS